MGPSNSEYQIDVAAAVNEIYQLKVRATMVMVEIFALSPGVQRSLIPKSKNSKNNRFLRKMFSFNNFVFLLSKSIVPLLSRRVE